jgi:exonuclease III
VLVLGLLPTGAARGKFNYKLFEDKLSFYTKLDKKKNQDLENNKKYIEEGVKNIISPALQSKKYGLWGLQFCLPMISTCDC